MVDIIKPIIAFASVVFMSGLCGLILLFADNKNNQTDWTMWCYMEILRLLRTWRVHSAVKLQTVALTVSGFIKHYIILSTVYLRWLWSLL